MLLLLLIKWCHDLENHIFHISSVCYVRRTSFPQIVKWLARFSYKKPWVPNPTFFSSLNIAEIKELGWKFGCRYLDVKVFLSYSRHHKYVGNICSVQDSPRPRCTLALLLDTEVLATIYTSNEVSHYQSMHRQAGYKTDLRVKKLPISPESGFRALV